MKWTEEVKVTARRNEAHQYGMVRLVSKISRDAFKGKLGEPDVLAKMAELLTEQSERILDGQLGRLVEIALESCGIEGNLFAKTP